LFVVRYHSTVPDSSYDVVILGGAFSGAAAALLLRRERPDLRVLVVEKSEAFDEKVGEATTEMSGMFLTRRLALWEHLERNHLPKDGLRFWFTNERVTGHANASEAGPYYRSTVPSFQLRRDVLDEHILALAVDEGTELARPARVTDVDLDGYENVVTFEEAGEEKRVSCRWVLDATGRACLLSRKLGLLVRNEDHPIAAIWCRWKGVKNIDDLAARDPELASRNVGSRRYGTNHYTGRGYWIWVIPLGNGETSIGVVFDRRLIDLHERRNRGADYVAFLRSNPALAEILDGAEPRLDGDLRFFSHLPYWSRKYMAEGWALLGDAAVFLDPYYSPGLDHAAFSIEATVRIVIDQLAGNEVGSRIAEHNETFLRSYHRFFRSVYRGKYLYMGEHDLLSAAMLIDTAQYYIFVVAPAYRVFKRFHWEPVLGPKPAFVSYHLMRLYHWRFQRLAELRRATGEAGRRNDGRRINAFFDLGLAPLHMALRGVKLWALAELDGLRLGVKKLFGIGVPGDGRAANADLERPASMP